MVLEVDVGPKLGLMNAILGMTIDILLSAICRDDNNQLFPIAWAVVEI